jgi:eukaryotic-like serine/threonine-protein kinase
VSAQGEAARPTRLGRYELITRIGQGGMAEVQLALQRGPAGFEKLVVVKLVHEGLATQKAFVDMLLDEARVAALVKHPNVVDIYDLGQADGRYFIAMEYLEGEPLLAVLRAGREGKRLDALSTGRLIADTAEGLDAAHELRSMSGERLELVHHDISLGNIVVLYNGQVKLVDFGVAKASQSAGPRAKVQGKFSYMAPEKLKGNPGDRRSDIFSLGCVMWEALTLKRLFRGGNDGETMKQVLDMAVQPPSKINGDVPAEYDPIVMRALDRDPDRRHGTAKELAVEIEELLRKRGYGAKNDRIAKYMQDTFKGHIDARKKLVQEVVNKGAPSAETLGAAFSSELANGSPLTTSATHKAADFGGYQRITPISGVPMLAFADSSKPTEISKSPFDGPTEISPPLVDFDPETTPHPIGDIPHPSLMTRIKDAVESVVADKQKRLIAAIAAGVLVLVLVLVIVTRGGSGNAAHAHTPVAADAGLIAIELPMPVDAAEIVAVAVDAGVPPDAPAVVVTPHPHPPPVEHPTAEQLFQRALQSFVKGDARTALATLKTAKQTNPAYAPTYRLLGQVYKKLGDKPQAKASFTHYLAIAPNAPDAATIRKELDQL